MTESTGKKNNRQVRIELASSFFEEEGSGWMRLSREAAIEVARSAADHGFIVLGIESGQWQAPGFKSNIEYIWDSVATAPFSERTIRFSNRDAGNFLQVCPEILDVFILTAKKVFG